MSQWDLNTVCSLDGTLMISYHLFYVNLCCLFGEGNGNPLQYSCLENPMGGGAWWAAVHGVAKSLTRLSDFTFTFHFHAWEKEMATHSSVLAWRIPRTEEAAVYGFTQSRTRLKWLSSSSRCFQIIGMFWSSCVWPLWNRQMLLLCSLVDNVIFIFPWWHMFGKELSLQI